MSYGIACFSQSGTKIFGSEFRTTNLQYSQSFTLAGNSTSSTFAMADANDSTKVSIAVFSTDRLFPGMFTVNTSSTGFTISNSTSSSRTVTVIALRIG